MDDDYQFEYEIAQLECNGCTFCDSPYCDGECDEEE
jgi:hypothetical protein